MHGGCTEKKKKAECPLFSGCGMTISAYAMTEIAYPGIDIAPGFH